VVEHIIDSGDPLINPNSNFKDWDGAESHPLQTLADICGYRWWVTLDVLDKAILLLKRGANVLHRGPGDSTLLHTVLSSNRADKADQARCFMLSKKVPQELLIAFISAGADVYAENDEGETPSMYARYHSREQEWIQALRICGFDAEEVFEASCLPCNRHARQTSKLSFREFCRLRERGTPYDTLISETPEFDVEDFFEDMRKIHSFEKIDTNDESEDFNEDEDSEGQVDHDTDMDYDLESAESDSESGEYEEGHQEASQEEAGLENDNNSDHHEASGNQSHELHELGIPDPQIGDNEEIGFEGMDFDFNGLFMEDDIEQFFNIGDYFVGEGGEEGSFPF
jgi:hypothetical protein